MMVLGGCTRQEDAEREGTELLRAGDQLEGPQELLLQDERALKEPQAPAAVGIVGNLPVGWPTPQLISSVGC